MNLGYFLNRTQKALIQKDTCTPMFTAALFTVAKIWKQPKCPSVDEWTKKMCYINTYLHTHNVIVPSHKKDKILPFETTWIYLKGITLSEVSQTKKNTV